MKASPLGAWRRVFRRDATPGTSDPLRRAVEEALERIPVDFGGGCPPKKALSMAWLIRAERIKVSADIGVYRGRSLMPQAVAHRDYTGGVAYGIDPFSNAEAVQRDNPALRERLDDFIRSTDFEAIYAEVLRVRESLRVVDHCRLVRKTSAQAAREFAANGVRFGLIHIDGNHDTAHVLEDAELYLPLLEPGGLIVMDDVSWDSVKPAVELVASRSTPLFFESAPTVTELDYAVYRLGGSAGRNRFLRESLRTIREAP